MSGGFFRGTSADQDTRFSNKQAKLMKSQKFAPELEHLVDMRKVKMDVIRPWIANRVTELLGFEDEVLINFIYGLLEAKEVNGKEVQISLTGFMEKNTGKFMKELWTLLLSAQKNESGVPQQFLDAKEEETRKKQNDQIQKKESEGKELDRERLKKMDGGAETKANVAAGDINSKYVRKSPTGDREEEKEPASKNGVRVRSRSSTSPNSADSLSSPHSEKHKSRSLSRSPEARRRSISSDKVYRSPGKRSVTPPRRYSSRSSLSPSRRRQLYLRQRSRSSSRRRSPSPLRRRLHSPYRQRSPSPIRRRSPSPVRRRRSPSPVRRRRSPSPVRRRRSPSPIRRRRSPSPVRRRRSPSPIRRRRSPSPLRRRRSPSPPRRRRSPSPISHGSPSPVWRRSLLPAHRRSPSPLRRRSPPLRRRSPSPRRRYQRSPSTPRKSLSPRHRSPVPPGRRSPIPSRRRSLSPCSSSSPSPVRRRSPSPVRPSKKFRSPVQSPGKRFGSAQDKSPPVQRILSNSLRSPQGNAKDWEDSRDKLPSLSPPDRSPIKSESPPPNRTRNASEDRRSASPYDNTARHLRERRNRSSSLSASPVRQRRVQTLNDKRLSPAEKPRELQSYQGSSESSQEEADHSRDYKSKYPHKQLMHSSIKNKQKDFPVEIHSEEEHSPERDVAGQVTESRGRLDTMEMGKKDQEIMSEKGNRKGAYPGMSEKEGHKDLPLSSAEGHKSDQKKHSRVSNDRHQKSGAAQLIEKKDHSNGGGVFDSDSDGSYKKMNKEKRKHKRSHGEEVASDDNSNDSEIDERKEAKRRRKEEKKLRKEEKRRRREERRRRKEERRAEKHRLKDTSDVNSSDGGERTRRNSHPSDSEDSPSEQRKLEIELRKKALESLKAKKGISH